MDLQANMKTGIRIYYLIFRKLKKNTFGSVSIFCIHPYFIIKFKDFYKFLYKPHDAGRYLKSVPLIS